MFRGFSGEAAIAPGGREGGGFGNGPAQAQGGGKTHRQGHGEEKTRTERPVERTGGEGVGRFANRLGRSAVLSGRPAGESGRGGRVCVSRKCHEDQMQIAEGKKRERVAPRRPLGMRGLSTLAQSGAVRAERVGRTCRVMRFCITPSRQPSPRLVVLHKHCRSTRHVECLLASLFSLLFFPLFLFLFLSLFFKIFFPLVQQIHHFRQYLVATVGPLSYKRHS